MFNYRRLFRTYGIAFLLSVAQLLAESQVSLVEIKKSLACQCDCNMTVDVCEGAMACDSAEKLTQQVKELIGDGKSKNQVLASFVSRYGETILSAPTKRGFNLTAWVLPFVALFIAGFGIIAALRRWTGKADVSGGTSPDKGTDADDSAYAKKLDEVLESLD